MFQLKHIGGLNGLKKNKINLSIGASVSASVLPMNIQDWFPLGWNGWISLKSKGLSRVFSWEDWRQEEKGTTEDEMVAWHHWLDGHEFEQALGVGDGQGSLGCCSLWGLKSWTRLRDWTELNWYAAYKRLTSDLKIHTDWGWRDEKSIPCK